MSRKRRKTTSGRQSGGRPGRYAPKQPPAGARLVRCLGPGAEHRFLSPDPVRVRICPRCTSDLNELNLSMRESFRPRADTDY